MGLGIGEDLLGRTYAPEGDGVAVFVDGLDIATEVFSAWRS
jgi:hypothetical protein